MPKRSRRPAPLLAGLLTVLCGGCMTNVSRTTFDPTGVWHPVDSSIGNLIAQKDPQGLATSARLPSCPIAGSAPCLQLESRGTLNLIYKRTDDANAAGEARLIVPPSNDAFLQFPRDGRQPGPGLPSAFLALGEARSPSCVWHALGAPSDPSADAACLRALPCSSLPSACFNPVPGGTGTCADGQPAPMGTECYPNSVRRMTLQDPSVDETTLYTYGDRPACRSRTEFRATLYFYSEDSADLWEIGSMHLLDCTAADAGKLADASHWTAFPPSLQHILQVARSAGAGTAPAAAPAWPFDLVIGRKTSYSRQTTNGQPAPLPPWAAQAVPPDCAPGFRFTEPLVRPLPGDKFNLTPLGQLVPPGHTFPIPHSYLTVRTSGSDQSILERAVFAPADMIVTGFARSEHIATQSESPTEVSLFRSYYANVTYCSQLTGYLIYDVLDPRVTEPTLAKVLDDAANRALPSCLVRYPGDVRPAGCDCDATICRYNVSGGPLKVFARTTSGGTTAPTRLGDVGHLPNYYRSTPTSPILPLVPGQFPPGLDVSQELGIHSPLDIGIRDSRLPPGPEAIPGFRGPDFRFAACPWNYLQANEHQAFVAGGVLASTYPDPGGVPVARASDGALAPCGSPLQDLPGFLQGLWKRAGTTFPPSGVQTESDHISLVHHGLHTDTDVFSWGTAFDGLAACGDLVGLGAREPGKCWGIFGFGLERTTSGGYASVNEPFHAVNLPSAGNISRLCYDGLRWAGGADDPPHGDALPWRLLLTLTGAVNGTTLKARLEHSTTGCGRSAAEEDWLALPADPDPNLDRVFER